VQIDPIKLTLKAPGTKRLKLRYDKLLSSFGFKINLRRYIEAMGGLPSAPVEYSSFAPQSRRAAALGSFRSGNTLLMVASVGRCR